MRTVLIALMMVLFTATGCAGFISGPFSGKVIDAETKEPIEGAVVVVTYYGREYYPWGSGITRLDVVDETLSDTNGEFKISKKLGSMPINYRYKWPKFTIYKRGYKTSDMLGGFKAYPYIDKNRNLEGIILIKPGNTADESKKFFSKYYTIEPPFIPVKNPEKRLRDLNFSFEYPDDVITVRISDRLEGGPEAYVEPFEVYTVVGLKKAKTWLERIESLESAKSEGEIPDDQIPMLKEMLREEKTYLEPIKSKYGYDRKRLNIQIYEQPK